MRGDGLADRIFLGGLRSRPDKTVNETVKFGYRIHSNVGRDERPKDVQTEEVKALLCGDCQQENDGLAIDGGRENFPLEVASFAVAKNN